MRGVFWFLGLAAIAVALALLVGSNHANVTIFWHPWRIDLSANLVLFGLLLLFGLLYAALRALNLLRRLPQQAQRWRSHHLERSVQQAVLEALTQQYAGRYVRSQAAARKAQALLGQAVLQPFPGRDQAQLLALLLLAESAHQLSNYGERDRALGEALAGPAATSGNEARAALQLRAARWAIEQQDAAAAARWLDALPQGVARRIHALRLAMQLQEILYTQGFGTRRVCCGLVQQGRVQVGEDALVCLDPLAEFAPEGLVFHVQGERWVCHAQAYLMLHKPAGFECSQKPGAWPSIYTLCPAPCVRARPGPPAVCRRWAGSTRTPRACCCCPTTANSSTACPRPSTTCPRCTRRSANTRSTRPGGPAVARGGARRRPAPVRAAACEALGTHGLRLTLTEGKYHQVKRMVAAVGNRVEALHRAPVPAVRRGVRRVESRRAGARCRIRRPAPGPAAAVR
jgi:16S rRNA U516 pseudouridylate synthase RsuA-like enzyme